jgi:hypothetical protein
MNEARIQFIPAPMPSAFGYNVQGPSFRPEMDGAMLAIGFGTSEHGSIEIRCTHQWALDLAERIKRHVADCKSHCKKNGVIPVEAKP